MLGLQGCQINHIPLETFEHMPKLKILDISYNSLRQLDGQVFKPLPQLTMVYLQE